MIGPLLLVALQASVVGPEEYVVGEIARGDERFELVVRGARRTIHGDRHRIVVTGAGTHVLQMRAVGCEGALLLLDERDQVVDSGCEGDLEGLRLLELTAPAGGAEWTVLVAAEVGQQGPYSLFLRDPGAVVQGEEPGNESVFAVRDPFGPHETLFYDGSFCGEALYIRDRERLEQQLRFLERVNESMDILGGDDTQRGAFKLAQAARLVIQCRLAEAEPLVLEALADVRRPERRDPEQEIYALNLLNTIYLDQCLVAKARANLDAMVSLLEQPGVGGPWRVHTLCNLGQSRIELGDLEQGLAVLAKCLDLAGELEPEPGRLTFAAQALVASGYADSGAFEEALAIYEELVPLGERLFSEGALTPLGVAARRLAMLVHLGRHAGVEEGLNQLLRRSDALVGEMHPLRAVLLAELGRVHAARGDLARAIEVTGEALRIFEAIDLPFDAASIRYELGRLHWRSGDHARAWLLLFEAVDATDRHLASSLLLLSERERFRLAGQLRARLDGLLELGMHLEDEVRGRQAYAAVLAWKGRVSRGFGRLLRGAQASGDPELVRLRGRLQEATAALALEALGGRDEGSHRRLGELREHRELLERELTRRLGEPEAHGRTPEDVLEQLPTGSVFVDFLLYRARLEHGRPASQRLAAWVLSPGASPALRRVELGESTPIREAMRAYLALVAEDRPSSAQGAALRRLVWDPLAVAVAAGDSLFLSPDGFLAGLPFEILPLDDGKYLLEEHGVVYTEGAVTVPRGVRADLPSLLLVGGIRYGPKPLSLGGDAAWNQLPWTEHEARGIETLHRECFGERAARLLLTDVTPTEGRLRSEMPRFAVLHLATHGYSFLAEERNRAVEPSRGDTAPITIEVSAAEITGALTGIACAAPSADGEDGVLSADEVALLDLAGVDLVVLSSCYGASGSPELGEGLLGLRRSFLLAGARTVIGALWEVSDRTTVELMDDFYTSLWRNGSTVVEAFRDARLAMLARRRAARFDDGSPASWGAFVLQGEP